MKPSSDFKRVDIDNLYDLLFNDSLKAKSASNLNMHVKVGSKGHLNILDAETNFKVEPKDEEDESTTIDLTKVKINKQFKLVNSLPKLKSVPATPQFFDMAGGYIMYPDAEVKAKEFEIQGGVFSAISGFFGS